MSLKKLRFVFLICISIVVQGVFAQDDLISGLKGYWEGAFIADNSQQPIQMQFYQEDGDWKCLQIMEEWHPQFGEFVQAVTLQNNGRLEFNTGYGRQRCSWILRILK